MSIFVSSGEASGDHYIAEVARRLRAAGSDEELWGMGGGESRDAGVDVLWPAEKLQLLGLTEVFSAIPMLFRLRNEMVDLIMERQPKAVVVCDSPDYHLRVLAKLKSRGYRGRVFYISPPSVWAWRKGRVKQLKRYVDENLPLFKFEHDYLCEHGCTSFWRGHPFAEEFRHEEKLVSPPAVGKVVFLPGSRRSEIKSLLPIMRETAGRLAERGYESMFSVAPGLASDVRAKMIEEFKRDGVAFYEGPGRSLMRGAACAVAASGTVTLEALLAECYTVVAYKLSPISAFAALLLIHIKWFAVPNILADAEVFPELLQWNATADNMTRAVLDWLENREAMRDEKKKLMAKARALLGDDGAYDLWCERITGVSA